MVQNKKKTPKKYLIYIAKKYVYIVKIFTFNLKLKLKVNINC